MKVSKTMYDIVIAPLLLMLHSSEFERTYFLPISKYHWFCPCCFFHIERNAIAGTIGFFLAIDTFTISVTIDCFVRMESIAFCPYQQLFWHQQYKKKCCQVLQKKLNKKVYFLLNFFEKACQQQHQLNTHFFFQKETTESWSYIFYRNYANFYPILTLVPTFVAFVMCFSNL